MSYPAHFQNDEFTAGNLRRLDLHRPPLPSHDDRSNIPDLDSALPVPNLVPVSPQYHQPQCPQADQYPQERGMPFTSNGQFDESYDELGRILRDQSPTRDSPTATPRKRLSTWGGKFVNWLARLTPLEVKLQGRDWAYEPHIEAVLEQYGCVIERKSERTVQGGYIFGAQWACTWGSEEDPKRTKFNVCLSVNHKISATRHPWNVEASCRCTGGSAAKFQEIGAAIIREVRRQRYHDGVTDEVWNTAPQLFGPNEIRYWGGEEQTIY